MESSNRFHVASRLIAEAASLGTDRVVVNGERQPD